MSTAQSNDGSDQPGEPNRSEELAHGFRLRADHPRVTRLSRRVLAGGTAVALVLVGGAVVWALQNNRPRGPAPDELYSTDHHNVADGLAGLPRDYAGVPRQVPSLGPPLPGDLGRPILAAQGQLPNTTTTGFDQEQQRRDQEIEAARVSHLFASTNVRETTPAAAQASSVDRVASSSVPGADDGFAQNGQDRKLAFVNASVDRRTTSPDRVVKPASPYVVQAGTVIPGALITGIRSDLPGQITAQVTENVYDTPSGRLLLVPQGARLIGTYDSQIAFGQSRVLLVWTRLIMPNGRSIVLERQPGADAAGYSGLEDDVDNHWGELFKAAALSTLLAVGSEVGAGSDTGNNGDIIQALRRGSSDSLNQTGQKIVQRNLNIQPTLTIRPGFPVRVIVNRDLVFEPYRG
ncbi:TrbI/VirB10 family protein [Bradyrhizobium sp. Bra78]|uniref:TrbI/VirB10 family protein n=1 Tax=Bradyrhizobium sp. Bra78 TaxID=2926010 RepID=UPI0021C749EF|nr:TrbI/VirB10 family protein [Bradyrhizobium sp. Bra78]